MTKPKTKRQHVSGDDSGIEETDADADHVDVAALTAAADPDLLTDDEDDDEDEEDET